MELKVLGSGSAGNCYVLENDTEILIIECGVRIDDIKKAINFNTSKVAGVLISHEHKDHCKSVEQVLSAGMKVFATKGTLNAIGIDKHHRSIVIKEQEAFNVGNFKIMAFGVKHDAAQPVGFLIKHSETGLVLFLTDTIYSPFNFEGLNNIIIEANYSQEIIDQKLAAGMSPEFLRNRILRSHMSLETCIKTLKASKLTEVNNIVLIHLSDSNSNANEFEKAVRNATGKNVHIADAGLIIPFNHQPF